MTKLVGARLHLYAGIMFLTLTLASCASVPLRYDLSYFKRFPGYDPTGQKKATSEAYYHYVISQDWLKEGNVDGAIYEIKEALVQDPASAFLRVNLADLYLKKGEVPSALAQAKKAVGQDANYLPGRVLLGHICAKTGDMAGAVKEYEAALKLEPSNQGVLLALSRLHLEMGHAAEAQRIAAQVRREEPGR